jgi:cell division protein ZapA
MSETLDLHLLGKDYRVACGDDERESLVQAVALIDDKVAALRAKTRITGERLAVMVALDLAHELVQSRSADRLNASPCDEQNNNVDSAELERSITSIEARIAAALAPTASLF